MTTAVLLSGGVDSSVALRLLQEEGHDDPATKVQAGNLSKTVSRPKWRNSWYYGHGESSARF